VPAVETVAVKEGIRRGSAAGLSAAENQRFNGAAIHLHPQLARESIRAAAERALRRRREIPCLTMPGPYELVSTQRAVDGRAPEVTRTAGDDVVAVLGWPAGRR